jgi:hypothetical protein
MVLSDARSLLTLTRLLALAAFLAVPWATLAADSGQRTFAQATVEPAIDFSTGNTVYVLTPNKSPFPAKANSAATAPLYLVIYPESSTVSAVDFNCLPKNCEHVNVLPFADPNYGAQPGTATACVHFNNGNPCSLVKGHDHLIGVASTGGDANVARNVKLVVFTQTAFLNGKINTRVTMLTQLQALLGGGEAIVIDTPNVLHASPSTKQIYDRATPVVIPFP